MAALASMKIGVAPIKGIAGSSLLVEFVRDSILTLPLYFFNAFVWSHLTYATYVSRAGSSFIAQGMSSSLDPGLPMMCSAK